MNHQINLFNKDNLSKICLDCNPINASTIIKVPYTFVYLLSYSNINKPIVAYTNTVLI